MQSYVNTGKFPRLQQFETALVYLALAHSRLGNETEAREAVLRLATAEQIEPSYSRLQLAADATEFSALASRLVPGMQLGGGTQMAQVQPQPQPQPQRIELAEQLIAQECARIQREADEKIAATIRAADERVAAAERAAAARIAEIERAASQRVAEAEANARRAAEQQRVAETRVPPPPPPSSVPPVQPPARPVETRSPSDWREAMQRANEFATAGRIAEANDIYARVAGSNASRDLRAQAATGLYRTRSYWQAVDAFARIAPFSDREADLRYYNAVSLYETGRFVEARHELACALPLIRQTDDVLRYRMMIEQMVAWHNAQPVVSVSQ
jgi:hypothetical protein